MEDLLTTRQVLNILKVDRITVYRMLQDGRIKGVKIGQQWRFPRKEVDRILNADQTEREIIQPRPQTRSGSFPTHCLQTIQDLFSFVAQVSSMIIDSEGNPLTEISQPCRYCKIILQSLPGLAACQESWKEIAKRSNTGSRYFTCHAGLQYISAPIIDKEKTVGYFLVGEFYWQAPSEHEVLDRAQALASGHNLSQATLSQAANTIPVIEKDQHSRVESWPIAAARAVQTILQERTSLIDRLQQIADLSKID
ncbi:MAG TPA: PocR ligand-binding domain-containing protein [Anaerolineaceae bacterium]|nr:PocR ligand-binding domain-containing protein [Anaerolineaceae bacterium]